MLREFIARLQENRRGLSFDTGVPSSGFLGEMPMARDWRDEQAYQNFDHLDVSGLAWECLRRNESYRADYAAMQSGSGDPTAWGLRFPSRSGPRSARRAGFLAPG
jgi:hypothetical protein